MSGIIFIKNSQNMLNADRITVLVYTLLANQNKNKVDVLILFMSNFKYCCIIVYLSPTTPGMNSINNRRLHGGLLSVYTIS